jgi:flavodoxin
MCAAVVLMVAVACTSNKKHRANIGPRPKVLVLYYSQTSNTKAVAQEIATRLHSDIEEITLVEPYDTAFQATIDRCKADREKGILPEIKPLKSNVADYDIIFLGYPIWFGTYAPPIATLLEEVDLSGKRVVPFCTFGSGGLESSAQDLAKNEPNAKVLAGYGVRAARMDAMPEELEAFLAASQFCGGRFEMLEDFPEQHPVNADEAAIFNAAVDGYPMLNAKAVTVAMRPINDSTGTEYLFTAKDMPREKGSKMPPSDIEVYVKVEKGKAPVFTRVVR